MSAFASSSDAARAATRDVKQPSPTRPPRPKYPAEHMFFIWYHRTDLAEGWDQVIQEFQQQFHYRRPKGGLQCKFYRLLADFGVEKVRAQVRQTTDMGRNDDMVGRYGVVQRTNRRFSWMRSEHQRVAPLPRFRQEPSLSRETSCSGCTDCAYCSA